ncbi:MAG: GIY-YIG nuclease family protein, partial [Collinsella sp.]
MALVSEFLIYLALSLPLYGVVVLMQKSFSALLDMKPYSRYCLYSAIGQAGSVLLFGVVLGYGMPAIALSYVVDYVVLVGCSLWWLRRRLHGLQVKSILHGGFFGLLFGGLGCRGRRRQWALTLCRKLGSSILITLGYVCVAGVVSLAVTFGLAFVFKSPRSRRCFVASRCVAGHDNIPTLAEQVSRVPTQPGCYLWKDAKGDVIYVGKAKNLRARMRQYVTLQDERQKIPLMMQLVASFDYIVVETEHEALVLERNLIGQYHPYFNVDLKDDKSYPFIAITKSDLFPAIKYTRERHKPGTRYFGPYTDSRAARETIDTLRKVIPICSASCAEWRRCRRIVESHKGEEDIVNM